MATASSSSANNTASPTFDTVGVRHRSINEAPGVNLSSHQKLLVGSVLDASIVPPSPSHSFAQSLILLLQLFAGDPTRKHLALWDSKATFADPLSIATGVDRFAAQWYGLAALFSPITIQSHKVISDGNPVEFELSNKYVVKVIKKEQVINSVVRIHVGPDGKIAKVEDKWNGTLPEGPISEVNRHRITADVSGFTSINKSVSRPSGN